MCKPGFNYTFQLLILIINLVAVSAFAGFKTPPNSVLKNFSTGPHTSVSIIVGWTSNSETGEDVLGAQLSYRGLFKEKSIRWIQTARVQNNDDSEFVFRGFQEDRNKNRSRNGYFLDQNYDTCAGDIKKCSYFYRDHFTNPDESRETDNLSQIADFPFGWTLFKRIRLESCAYNLNTLKYEACVLWGAEWPLIGDRQIFNPVLRKKPSADFVQALQIFKKFYNLK